MTDPTTRQGSPIFASEEQLAAVTYNDDGLVPAIVQEADTGRVLMMAWMNADAIRETLASGRVCYWSRSRAALWKKGETSGQIQALKELRVDCDGDTILVLVDQIGVACHTGRRNCFYRAVRDGAFIEIADVETDPAALYGDQA